MLISEPLLQNVFAVSLKLPKSWHSLVFYVAAVSHMPTFLVSSIDHHQAIYTAVGICTLFIYLDLKDGDVDLE